MARRVYVAEAEIDASPAEVWATLVDLPSYPTWNPFTVSVRSSLEVGAPVRMRVRMVKLGGIVIPQDEMLRAIEPPTRLVWGATMLGGAIEAERVQTLTALDGDRCRYRTEDVIEGPLAGFAMALTGASVQAGFEAMAAALKVEVERRVAGA